MGKVQSFDIFHIGSKNLKSFQSGPRVLLQQGLDVACGAAGPPGGFEGFIGGFEGFIEGLDVFFKGLNSLLKGLGGFNGGYEGFNGGFEWFIEGFEWFIEGFEVFTEGFIGGFFQTVKPRAYVVVQLFCLLVVNQGCANVQC